LNHFQEAEEIGGRAEARVRRPQHQCGDKVRFLLVQAGFFLIASLFIVYYLLFIICLLFVYCFREKFSQSIVEN
jgi:hypothetical protein